MKCLIIDDEPIARMGMRRLVGRHSDLELTAQLGSAEEALEFLEENKVDLIFLDIQMPGLTGMELAEKIKGDAMIIFTTAYSEYALESYNVNAVDYLVKPINPDRFDKAVEKARSCASLLATAEGAEEAKEAPQLAADFIIVKADRRYMRIHLKDILYVQGLKDYLIIYTNDRKVVTRMTLKGMEDTLPSDRFFRVNKSYIVNLDAIDSFDNNDIFIGNQEIAIGPNFREPLLRILLPSKE